MLKRDWMTGALSLLLLGSMFAFPAMAQEAQKVILNEDPWPPYTLGEEGQPPTGGLAVDVIQEVFKRLRVPVELWLYPWKRCLFLVKEGAHDGHMLLLKTPEWEEYMLFTVPFIPDRYLFWYRADRPQPIEWQDFADLKAYKIGLTTDYSYGDEFPAMVKTHNLLVDYARSDELNFKRLLAGRIDAFLCMENVAKMLFKLRPEFQGQFKAAAKPLMQLEMYMAISKTSKAAALLPDINRVILEMQADGTLERLVKGN